MIETTIDINMSEMQYLADHLHPEECRRLFASVHFASYDEPNNLDQAENQVSKDIPCIRLLLHWNSAEGEGRGETHEVLEHRLRQMGKYELADWLGRTVFHQLGQELKQNLDHPFGELATEKESPDIRTTFRATTIEIEDVTEWIPFDTICSALIVLLVVITLLVLFRVICMLSCRRRKKKKKTRFSNKKRYRQLENYSSETDSEDVLSVRMQNREPLNLAKISNRNI